MTTLVDIANRALQLLGTRSIVASLGEQSNEAVQMNLCLTPIQNWCFGLANWNFARTTAALTIAKGPPPTGPGNWSTTYPPPPWLYEYTLPTNFIRALYMTNNATANLTASAAPGWVGDPKRFAIASDTVTGVQQPVLLTNESVCYLIYTAFVTDPTQWPWYFERLVVDALAVTVCMALTGNQKLLMELAQTLEQQINISTQANAVEGLIIADTTPEWNQALGINFPYRRVDGQTPPQPPQPQRGGRQ